MTTQLLNTELANLIQESKRKHNDLRQAAEKSLEELKQLGSAAEQGVREWLSQRPNFVNPFIIACGTKNAKFTGIAIVCLQRLIVARALPEAKLNQVLEALMQASSAGLDVQLKILQALPSLVQNYSSELKGDLLVTTLNICFILQSSKNAIVNNTSAATLQQLVVSVFDKVVSEDKKDSDSAIAGEVPSADGTVQLHAAALDAYRIFNDLCLMTENQRPEFLRLSSLPQTFGLELIESVITNHASVFTTHPEQAQILRIRAMPLIMSALKGKPSFAKAVRLVRILYTMLRRHIDILPNECGDALDVLIHVLDQDSALWRRALCMEVFRGIFSDYSLARKIYSLYDAKKFDRSIIKTLAATFVRLSTEKPAVIGLGHQSTVPMTFSPNASATSTDQAMLEAGMGGIISGAIASDAPNTGISTQWSSIRVPCIDQLDKTDPPPIPESYVYSLILSCLSSLSDGMAKFILPLTVATQSRNHRKASKHEGQDLSGPGGKKQGPRERAASFKKSPVSVNPLQMEDHPMYQDVKICAALVEECWPAILATFSTFLYAALDSEYYHGLVRSFQRFAHVSGLLQLTTPRDAFLTTLGKSAVPPNVLTACLNAGQPRPTTPSTPSEAASSLLSNARGLLSVEALTPSSPAERQRQPFFDTGAAYLNTRNLLCLRALLNLGIALGPNLGLAWYIVFETLQQADFVLYATGKSPGRPPSISRSIDSITDNDALMTNFNTEIRSVETAATRLIESTIDFPNSSFVEVIKAVCSLLDKPSPEKPAVSNLPSPTPSESQKPLGHGHRRVLSFSGLASTSSKQEFLFALAKLGELATVNMERLLMEPPSVSGWHVITGEIIQTLNSAVLGPAVRVRAAEVLTKLTLEAAAATSSISENKRGEVQTRLLTSLRDALEALNKTVRSESVSSVATDVDVHRLILEGLKSIIEGCGENLVSGWDIAFEIIGSGFVSSKTATLQEHTEDPEIGLLSTRSPRLTRSAFGSLQLICSDFLSSLPHSCFLILVDTLYKFCSQDDDLNIALTTVTFFWVLSDFLSAKANTLAITADVVETSDESEFEKQAADRTHKGSEAALWMLLLLRLTTLTSDKRLDLRNSAIQTLLRIFDAYGDRLSPEAWSICIRSVIFKLLTSLEEQLKATACDSGEVDNLNRADWHGTAVVVLDGLSALLANHITILTSHSAFHQLWRELLHHFTTLLDFNVLNINTAIFKSLSYILSHAAEDQNKPALNKASVKDVWDLWARGIPKSINVGGKNEDNQNCLVAYVSALREIYKLIQTNLTAENVKRMLTLLRQAVEKATVVTYSQDIEHTTNLQGQIMAAVEMIRSDVDGVPSAIIKQVSEFVMLAYDQELFTSGSKRTCVAMSKASIQHLEKLILDHATNDDIYSSGAFSQALAAIHQPITLKYRFPIKTKSVAPWRLATASALSILHGTLPQLSVLDVSTQMVQEIWTIVVQIADGILSAQCDDASPGTALEEDEDFDISSFRKLQRLIIPALGAEEVANDTRKAYAESLFKNSMIHNVSGAEQAFSNDDDEFGLPLLHEPRAGKTISIQPTKRRNMAYVALDELFALMSADKNDERPPSSATVKPKAISGSKKTFTGDKPSVLRNRIAESASPPFILRCALTIRTYIADQPLRGHMPQPLSQRKELIWILTKLIELDSRGEAIPSFERAEGERKKHLLRLYPLLVQALSVGRDEVVLKLLEEALEAIGGELGIA